MDDDLENEQPLEYTIVGSSGHSGNYVADNIIVDSPGDQTSRWSGAFPSPLVEQWIMLRLESPSVVKRIKFGKFYKNHPCSTKDFRVLAGLTPDTLREVVRGSLKNDAVAESFRVRHIDAVGVPFPSLYVKIIPLSAHNTSYHTSLWHVALTGITDEVIVRAITDRHNKLVESVTVRYVLKFLRAKGMSASYDALLAESGVDFEDELLKELHQALITGDFQRAEVLLRQASDTDLFSKYLQSSRPTAIWKRVDPSGNTPPARGGHAMCIDDKNGIIYIHGGFDGDKCLDDFWSFSISEGRWTMLNGHTSSRNGPGPRSCHSIVVDDATGDVYLLGRLSDEDAAEYARIGAIGDSDTAPRPPSSELPDEAASDPELWCYHTRGDGTGSWERASLTNPRMAPRAIFDHRMVMVPHLHKIFVYGGRILDKDAIRDSEWHAYSTRDRRWESFPVAVSPQVSSTPFAARFSHAMTYDPNLHLIFILGGNQKEQQLSDFWTFNVDSHIATEVCADVEQCGDVETVTRAVINSSRNEMVISTKNDSYWLYRYEPTKPHEHGTWLKVNLPPSSEEPRAARPAPRSAHQVVYHSGSGHIFVHGGKAGGTSVVKDDAEPSNTRLDDFWILKLERTTSDTVVRKAMFLIRTQRYREMCVVSPVQALEYLQKEVFAVVDHSNPTEASAFQDLLSDLFLHTPDNDETPQDVDSHSDATSEQTSTLFEDRTTLFQGLMQFFPKDKKEPSSNLLSLVTRSL